MLQDDKQIISNTTMSTKTTSTISFHFISSSFWDAVRLYNKIWNPERVSKCMQQLNSQMRNEFLSWVLRYCSRQEAEKDSLANRKHNSGRRPPQKHQLANRKHNSGRRPPQKHKLPNRKHNSRRRPPLKQTTRDTYFKNMFGIFRTDLFWTHASATCDSG